MIDSLYAHWFLRTNGHTLCYIYRQLYPCAQFITVFIIVFAENIINNAGFRNEIGTTDLIMLDVIIANQFPGC